MLSVVVNYHNNHNPFNIKERFILQHCHDFLNHIDNFYNNKRVKRYLDF